ncbi:hypothetical protein [Streptomyces sp. ST2-7A]|uniref:hypothetical protein n=1 Tax=Streptomyces sp. ST2-7A TaxID=2907214 RepID=UPI001F34AAD9|nr:hypothetical protein [Streptomyces sp. ST2-7A]MCE7082783.1 hypothetical protein [Streptomyces sp. ST2-7A]
MVNGILLLVIALLLLGLGMSDFARSSATASETARMLWQYQIWPFPMMLNVLQWMGALLAVPVGVLLMARRRAANGPAIVLGGLLGFFSLRLVAGPYLARAGGVHHDHFSDPGRFGLHVLVFGLCVAVVAIAAGRARAGTASGKDSAGGGFDPYGPRAVPAARRWAGVLTALPGLLMVGWTLYLQFNRYGKIPDVGWGTFLQDLFVPGYFPMSSVLKAGMMFEEFVISVVLVVLGTVLLAGRGRGAPGAVPPAMALLVVSLVPALDHPFRDNRTYESLTESAQGVLWLVSLAAVLVSAIVATVLCWRVLAAGRRSGGRRDRDGGVDGDWEGGDPQGSGGSSGVSSGGGSSSGGWGFFGGGSGGDSGGGDGGGGGGGGGGGD